VPYAVVQALVAAQAPQVWLLPQIFPLQSPLVAQLPITQLPDAVRQT
jgi:hypothetical protein